MTGDASQGMDGQQPETDVDLHSQLAWLLIHRSPELRGRGDGDVDAATLEELGALMLNAGVVLHRLLAEVSTRRATSGEGLVGRPSTRDPEGLDSNRDQSFRADVHAMLWGGPGAAESAFRVLQECGYRRRDAIQFIRRAGFDEGNATGLEVDRPFREDVNGQTTDFLWADTEIPGGVGGGSEEYWNSSPSKASLHRDQATGESTSPSTDGGFDAESDRPTDEDDLGEVDDPDEDGWDDEDDLDEVDDLDEDDYFDGYGETSSMYDAGMSGADEGEVDLSDDGDSGDWERHYGGPDR